MVRRCRLTYPPVAMAKVSLYCYCKGLFKIELPMGSHAAVQRELNCFPVTLACRYLRPLCVVTLIAVKELYINDVDDLGFHSELSFVSIIYCCSCLELIA